MADNEEFFKSFPVSIRGFFINEYDSIDAGKNYLIPIYQRRYVWDKSLVSKLVDDIKFRSDQATLNIQNPYFIGGIVLCREVTNKKPPYTSLEVIDGQQRLTTVSMIIAAIYYQFKYNTSRKFLDQKAWIIKQSKEIENLLFLEIEIPGTFDIKTGYKLERTDELNEIFSNILLSFKEGTFKEEFNNTKKQYENISKTYSRNLIEAAQTINNILKGYDDFELTQFYNQLLKSTFLVVTKTIDVDTGFMVFEKLNDSGASLEPQDLLKSYLFSDANENEYETLSSSWKKLIDIIENINEGTAKISPREFLDNYLTIKDLESGEMDKTKIFKSFKEHYHTEDFEPKEIVQELIDIALKYQELKKNTKVIKTINAMNFKLGYLLLLTFFYKFNKKNLKDKTLQNDPFQENFFDILNIITRLGFTYIMSGNSKKLGDIVKNICHQIVITDVDKIDEIYDYINKIILKVENEFKLYLKTQNIFTKKKPSKLLLRAINLYLGDKINTSKYKTFLFLPEVYNKSCGYSIDKLSYPLHINRLGNITLVPNDFHQSDEYCCKSVIHNIIDDKPTLLSEQALELIDKGITELDFIDNRSEILANYAGDVFIHNKLDISSLD